MLWLDDMTRARAIKALLASAGLGYLWSAEGPTNLARQPGTSEKLTLEERIMLSAAWALWDGSGTLRITDLVCVDERWLDATVSLVMAFGTGQGAIEAWIAEHETPTLGRRANLPSDGTHAA